MAEYDLIALLEGKKDRVVVEETETFVEPELPEDEEFDESKVLKAVETVKKARGVEKLGDDAVRVLLLSFSLPSEYKGSFSKYEVDGELVREVRRFTRDPSKYRSLRSEFYSILGEIAYKCEIGWALMHNRDVRPLAEVIEKLNALGGDREVVEVIEALLPRQYLIRQISQFIVEKKSAIDLRLKKKAEGAREGKVVDKEINEIKDQIARLEEEIKFLESLVGKGGE